VIVAGTVEPVEKRAHDLGAASMHGTRVTLREVFLDRVVSP
jgi:hypothetical protein